MTAQTSSTRQLLFFSLPLFALFSLTAMAPMNLAFGIVALCWAISLALRFKSSEPCAPFMVETKREYYFYTVTLVLTCFISLVAALYWPYAYADHVPTVDTHTLNKLLHFTFPLIYLSLFSFCSQNASSEKNLNLILKVWWASCLVLLVIGVTQFFTGIIHSQTIPSSPRFFHVTLFFGHHLSTASIMIFPAFAGLAVALGQWIRTKKMAWLEFLAGISGIVILVLSFARTAWLAIPLGLILLLVFMLRGVHLKKGYLATGLGAVALLLGGLLLSPTIQERIRMNVGVSERVELWKANLDYFSHRPLTGIGFLKTEEMSQYYFKEKFPAHYTEFQWGHAHNNFLEMLGGAGILGLLAFTAWMLFSLGLALNTVKIARAHGAHRFADLALGLGVALILLHFNGLTQVNFWEGKVFHQQMWAVGLLLIIQFTVGQSRHTSPKSH